MSGAAKARKTLRNVYRPSLLKGEDRERYDYLMKQIAYLEEKVEFLERVKLLAAKSNDESCLDSWLSFSIGSEVVATYRERKMHLREKGEIKFRANARQMNADRKAERLSHWKGVQPINATFDWTKQ